MCVCVCVRVWLFLLIVFGTHVLNTYVPEASFWPDAFLGNPLEQPTSDPFLGCLGIGRDSRMRFGDPDKNACRQPFSWEWQGLLKDAFGNEKKKEKKAFRQPF